MRCLARTDDLSRGRPRSRSCGGEAEFRALWTAKAILCGPFAPHVTRTMQNARYHNLGNGHLTCGNIGGRYWDRTSDLFGVNADAAAG
jgi:hypothetical protein